MAAADWFLTPDNPRKTHGPRVDKRGRPVRPPRRRPRPAVGSGATVTVPGADTGYHGTSDAALAAQANAAADAQLGVSRAEILRQQASAAAAARRDAGALAGLGSAQMQMIGQIPAQIQDIRDRAAKAIAGFGGSVSADEASRLQGQQSANADFAASQGQSGPNPGAVDASKVAAATQALGGTIPAQQSEEIGAASAIAASGMPAVVARATQEQIGSRMAQAASEDADFRQQLISLAATRGGIYQDALSNLYDIESKKFGQWEATQRLALDQKSYALQVRAENANEKIAGIKTKQTDQKIAIDQKKLLLANKKQAADLQKQIQAGKRPDPALSKVYGFVVDKDGNPILDSQGQRIPVAKNTADQKAKAAASAKKDAAAHAKNVQSATRDAQGALTSGKPQVASRGRGQYITDPSKRDINGPNMYDDGTTDNPDFAAKSGRPSFAQEQSYLMTAYGLSKAEARKVLKAAGW